MTPESRKAYGATRSQRQSVAPAVFATRLSPLVRDSHISAPDPFDQALSLFPHSCIIHMYPGKEHPSYSV